MEINAIIAEEYYDMSNIIVYHGTDGEFDKFDLNKIGSGTGNSVGGWGLYFSDNERVANQYRSGKGHVKSFILSRGRYFDLEDSVTSGDGDMIINGMRRKRIPETEINEFENEYNVYGVTNKQAYEWLSYVMGGEKQASLFLKSLGYDGNHFKDRTIPEANNFVIYNLNIIKDNDDIDDEY
jgi:hypothetical protein